MKRLPTYFIAGILAILWGCASPKTARRQPATSSNRALSHWIATDSASNAARKRSADAAIEEINLKRLRDNLDKSGDSDYWGESIYYMLQDLLNK